MVWWNCLSSVEKMRGIQKLWLLTKKREKVVFIQISKSLWFRTRKSSCNRSKGPLCRSSISGQVTSWSLMPKSGLLLALPAAHSRRQWHETGVCILPCTSSRGCCFALQGSRAPRSGRLLNYFQLLTWKEDNTKT